MNWDDFINYELFELGTFKLLVGNLLIGIFVCTITILVVSLLKRAILKPRFIIDKIDEKRRMTFYLITKYVIWMISFFILLEVIGVKITPLLLGSTALLVGLGLGLQNIFKDFISGLFLLFEGTIKIGDIIAVDGEKGKVVEINLRSSEILTQDDVTIIIPNSRFIVEKVINWSHDTNAVRFQVRVSLAYGSDVELVFKCLEQAMAENKEVLNKPKSFVRFSDFGESALNFDMIFWSNNTFRIDDVKSDLRRAVYGKLNESGLSIPFPQRDINIKGMEQMVNFKEDSVKN